MMKTTTTFLLSSDYFLDSQVSSSCPWATCLAHLSRRLTWGAYWMGLKPASVCASICLSVCASTLSNIYIPKTSRPIVIKLSKALMLAFNAGYYCAFKNLVMAVNRTLNLGSTGTFGKLLSYRLPNCYWILKRNSV